MLSASGKWILKKISELEVFRNKSGKNKDKQGEKE